MKAFSCFKFLAFVCVVLTFGASVCTGQETESSTRPATIEDWLNREIIKHAQPSPDGRFIAVEIQRPATTGERYVAISPRDRAEEDERGDVWIIDTTSGHILWRTNGGPAGRSYYLPQWSPNGKRLAYLTTTASGEVRLNVWELSTSKSRVFASFDIATWPSIAANYQHRKTHGPFAWAGDDAVIAVIRGKETRTDYNGQLLGEAMVKNLAASRNATWQGKLSVRVWDSADIPLCGDSVQLSRIFVTTGQVDKLVVGSVRAVSVAPDGRRVAVTLAVSRLPIKEDTRVEFPLHVHAADQDTFVRWQVLLIDSLQNPRQDPPPILSGGGVMPFYDTESKLPDWSVDSQRLSIVTRREHTNRVNNAGDGSSLCDLRKSTCDYVPAKNPSEASLIAGIYVASGSSMEAERRIAMAPEITSEVHFATPSPEVFDVGRGMIAYVDKQAVSILGVSDVFRISELGGGTIEGSVSNGDEVRIFVRKKERIGIVHVKSGVIGVSYVGIPHSVARYVGIGKSDSIILVGDTEDGTFLWSVRGNSATVQLLRLNQYVRNLTRPKWKLINYSVNGAARTGVLYYLTPPERSHPLPVIVFAYPGATTDPQAWRPPFYYPDTIFFYPLLSAGFAVFHVDFRLPIHSESDATHQPEPINLVQEEMLPAVEELKKEPLIDFDRKGFVGHSFGGYVALALLAKTDIFRAIVAAASFPDLIQHAYSIYPDTGLIGCAPGLRLAQESDLEGDSFISMGGPPTWDMQRYIRNSPLLNFQKANTPTLLIHGEMDGEASSVEAAYLALLRKGVPVQLALYWGEDHVLESPNNIRDAVSREIKWFHEYLSVETATR